MSRNVAMSPLRVGIAGLGNVGGAVLRRLTADASVLAIRTGRPIAVVGVAARDRAKAAPLLGDAEWFDDAVALARAPDRRPRRAHRRPRRRGARGRRSRDRVWQSRRHRQQGAARPPRHGDRGGSRGEGCPAELRSRVAGGIPAIRCCASRSPATRSTASTASSTAPATTSSPAWRPRASASTRAWRRRSGWATPRPTRPSTSTATTRPTNSPSWRPSPSAPRSTSTRSTSKASAPSPPTTSRPPTTSATA